MATSPFERCPNELIERIAFLAATLGPPGPPTALVTIQLLSHRFASMLSMHANPHFYVLIFNAKFDSEAYYRRLGPEAKRPENVIEELKRRFKLLTGFKGRQHCFAEVQRKQIMKASIPHLSSSEATQSSRPTPSSPGDGENIVAAASGSKSGQVADEGWDGVDVTLSRREMLWAAYLMMLENDGLNERMLREYARLNVWLRNFWFDPEGASCAINAIRDNLWPPTTESSALAMWLLWLSLKPEEFPTLDKQTRSSALSILKLFAFGAPMYPLDQPEWADSSPTFFQRDALPTSYASYPLLIAPPLAPPAILSYLTLAPKTFNKEDTFKNSPLAPSEIRKVLKGEALIVEEESGYGEGDRDQDRDGGKGQEGLKTKATASKGKGKPRGTEIREGQWIFDWQSDSVTEEDQLDLGDIKLSFERELDWKRCISLAKYRPQPPRISIGPFGIPGRFALGGAGMGAAGQGAPGTEMVRPMEVYQLGSLEGVWEGILAYSESTAYAAFFSGPPLPGLHDMLVARHQHTWNLYEYHLVGPEEHTDESQSDYIDTTHSIPDRYRPLSTGGLQEAYFPDGVDVSIVGGGQARLEIGEPGRRERLVYHRCPGPLTNANAHAGAAVAPSSASTSNVLNHVSPFGSSPDTLLSYQRRVRDVIITGEGHSGWGPFNFIGRVRPYDGFVTLLKEYVEGGRGKWLYRGYLVGDTYGSFTGRWRDVLCPEGIPGYEGPFYMGRKRG